MTKRSQRDVFEAARTEPFTNREMQQLAGVSLMTLHLWRQGTVTKKPMRANKLRNGGVRYPVKATLNWLKRYDITPSVHPDDLENGHAKKPGPVRKMRSGPKRLLHTRFH